MKASPLFFIVNSQNLFPWFLVTTGKMRDSRWKRLQYKRFQFIMFKIRF